MLWRSPPFSYPSAVNVCTQVHIYVYMCTLLRWSTCMYNLDVYTHTSSRVRATIRQERTVPLICKWPIQLVRHGHSPYNAQVYYTFPRLAPSDNDYRRVRVGYISLLTSEQLVQPSVSTESPCRLSGERP